MITKKLVRKVLELLKKMSKDDEGADDEEDEESEDEDGEKKKDAEKKKKDGDSTYSKFYKEFGKNLKMGCYEDDSNRSKISKLLRFTTTKSDGEEISLDKYLDNMPEKQDSIYYLSGKFVSLSSLEQIHMYVSAGPRRCQCTKACAEFGLRHSGLPDAILSVADVRSPTRK